MKMLELGKAANRCSGAPKNQIHNIDDTKLSGSYGIADLFDRARHSQYIVEVLCEHDGGSRSLRNEDKSEGAFEARIESCVVEFVDVCKVRTTPFSCTRGKRE